MTRIQVKRLKYLMYWVQDRHICQENYDFPDVITQQQFLMRLINLTATWDEKKGLQRQSDRWFLINLRCLWITVRNGRDGRRLYKILLPQFFSQTEFLCIMLSGNWMQQITLSTALKKRRPLPPLVWQVTNYCLMLKWRKTSSTAI